MDAAAFLRYHRGLQNEPKTYQKLSGALISQEIQVENFLKVFVEKISPDLFSDMQGKRWERFQMEYKWKRSALWRKNDSKKRIWIVEINSDNKVQIQVWHFLIHNMVRNVRG